METMKTIKTLNEMEDDLTLPFLFLYAFLALFRPVVTLDLGHNFLNGQIPETLGSIATLEEIRLNDNLLQGGIPLSFGNLSSLGE